MKKMILTLALCLFTAVTHAQVYDNPEVMASFPGGLNALMTFLKDNLKYPADCEKEKVEGRVLLNFIVNEDGSITDAKTLRDPDKRLAEEAHRVLKLMPKWNPGQINGKNVKMKYTLPITFKLPKNSKTAVTPDMSSQADALSKGKTEDPKGLYRLLRFSYENGKPDNGPHIDQYKYCADNMTLQLQVQKDVEKEFWMTILHQDQQPLKYTGLEKDRHVSIYDSDSKSFKMRWYNTIMNNDYFPPNQYITELYSSEVGINKKMERVIDLLKMHTTKTADNKFYGCWRRLGVLTKMDGMDMLMPGHQDLYQIFDKDVYLHFYELVASRMYAYCILRPITYKSDNLLIQYGSESKIEWVDDHTFKLLFDRGDGTIVTELWKRSGLPKSYQDVFGTAVPVYEVPANPLPNYFGR